MKRVTLVSAVLLLALLLTQAVALADSRPLPGPWPEGAMRTSRASL